MNRKKNEIMYTFALMMQLGLSVIFPVIMMLFVAKWLKQRYDLSNGVLLAGMMIGLSAGFLNAYKLLSRFFQNKK